MIWFILLALFVLIVASLWKFGGFTRSGLEYLLAALLIGIAGYIWQGSPAVPAHIPVPPADALREDSGFAKERQSMMGRFGNDADILNWADSLHRLGYDQGAASVLRDAVRKKPKSPDLWVGLGNALVLHADGMVTPAAEFAFRKALSLAPNHPGPAYFMGLAYAQSGQYDLARETWQNLLNSAPANAPWRASVEERLTQLSQVEP